MKSNYTIVEGRIIIRPTVKLDIFNYINSLGFGREVANESKRKFAEILEHQEDDAKELLFTILKNGKMIGMVFTEGLADSPCDAMVRIALLKGTSDRKKVEELFIKLCLETYLYDDIYIVPSNGDVNESRKVMISDSSRRETS